MVERKNMLFLYGVFKRDCIDVEGRIEDKILLDMEDTTLTVHYDTIPDNFTSLEDWTRTTNLLCWQCDAQFDVIPVFIPEYIIKLSNNKMTMKVRGNFCSFPCASGFNKIHTPGGRKWERNELLKKLYTIFYNLDVDIDEIPSSPPKTYMIQYGEKSWTRQQYDDAIALSMSSYKDELLGNSIESIEVTSKKKLSKLE